MNTGIQEIDNIIGELKTSELLVIGGDYSIGKTSLLVSLLKNISVENKIPSTFFNYRDTNQTLMNRLLSIINKIPFKNFLTSNFTENERMKIFSNYGKIEKAPIFFVDDFSNIKTFEEFKIKCIYSIRQNSSKIIFINNLQQFHNFLSDNVSISQTIRNLKSISKELNILIIVSSNITVNGNKAPKLSDFPFYEEIEETSDIIFLINRPEFYKIYEWDDNYSTCVNQAEIIIAKNRFGKNSNVKISYNNEYKYFSNLENIYIHSNSEVVGFEKLNKSFSEVNLNINDDDDEEMPF